MMVAVVAAMTLGELLGPAAGIHSELEVTDLVSDSRQVTPGAAFIALKGETSHGLDFAGRALASGAAAVLYEPAAESDQHLVAGMQGPAVEVLGLRDQLGELGRRFYGSAEPADELIGVTGTNGKTTVAWLVAQALTDLDRPCAYLGTLGQGMPGALAPQSLTTPDCMSLHQALASFGTSNAAIEVSSHALAQDRVAGLDFSIAAFTNLTRDHLDWHGNMDAYFEAKARLFVRPGLRAAVINADDACAEALLGRLAPETQALSIGFNNPAATLRGRVCSSSLSGTVLEVESNRGAVRVESPLVGSFNGENLLVALGIMLAADTELTVAGEVLGRAVAPPGRMEVFGGSDASPWVVVDYAHTPNALERVLGELSTASAGELTCVFGCGGERDQGKRGLMGQAAARYAAHIVLTDDNPRSEDPAAIVADIKSGIGRHPDLRVQHARELAIADAIESAGPGDIVLIAGKGHESTQHSGDEARAFDDRVVVRQALEAVS